MFSELEEKAFIIVDSFLNDLSLSKNNGFFSTYGKPNEFFLAKEIMDKYQLISYRNPGSKTSIVDISQNGLIILRSGGIKKYLSDSMHESEERE
ncbi:MAG: hypothetical protein JSU05_15880 [Bacteroidetes bacterium]|nr:hypothetical protein [Bacteroidota bacterium]